jgi:cysteinyl-tRNA synthetase
MSLVVYNTLSGKKEEFVPIAPPKVGMYTCGITAYDSCHLGHARAAVVFDVIYRYLLKKGFDVTFAKNFTDVDDKIIARANREGRSCDDIAGQYMNEYDEDMASLGLKAPSIAPKATEHIDSMIEVISKLIERGLAYESNGSVYYSVRKFSGYGKLSGKKIEELESGARVDIDESKADPLDFALWKAAKPDEPKWSSPWGDGRPGWHIECSAMSTKYLGQPFDIHGGGRDLVFPHHENEIAQAEGANGKQFSKYWLHNGFININAEKMSKSLGNIMSIREVLKKHDREAVKLFLVSNHYRSPIDYTQKAIEEAEVSLNRFYEASERVHGIHPGKAASKEPDGIAEAADVKEALSTFDDRFYAAMDDDFNTARAVGVIFETVRAVNRYLDAADENPTSFAGWVVLQFTHMQHVADDVLGIFGSNAGDYRQRGIDRASSDRGIDESWIEDMLGQRREARKSKNFARADAIRDELTEKGIEIKDRPDGTTEWRVS